MMTTPWGKASTLEERLRLHRTRPLQADVAKGEHALQQWRQQPPFEHPEYFEARFVGPSEDELRQAMGWDGDGPCPEWATRLASMYDDPPQGPRFERPDVIFSVRTLLHPLFADAVERVLERVSLGAPLPDRDALSGLLHRDIPVPDLYMMGARVVVVELNIARLRNQLTGDHSSERAESFRELLRDPVFAMEVLQRWPVLSRQLVEVMDLWVEAHVELLTRLQEDWSELVDTRWNGRDPGCLTRIAGGGGDHHGGRRAVTFLRFGEERLVYKPRSLAVDLRFRELVRFLEDRGDLSPVPFRTQVRRAHHGWEEWTERVSCTSDEEVRSFYRHLGRFAAVLSMLDATDMHAENLVAAGPYPELLDLECLFQPRAYAHRGADDLTLQDGDEFYTVLRTGLLPVLSWTTQGGIDLSAVGVEDGFTVDAEHMVLTGSGTDEAHFERQTVSTSLDARNQPHLHGAPVDASAYVADFEAGFAELYRVAVDHRDEMLAGPIAAFAEVEVRVLARNTRTYADLLYASFHPDYLRDACSRERLFDGLWRDVVNRSYLAALIPLEQRDLQVVDVPLFSTRPGCADLIDSHGAVLSNFYAESSLDWVARRVMRLGERDLDNQLYAIRAAFDTLTMNRGTATPPTLATGRGDVEAAARALGAALESRALTGDDYAFWVGVRPRGARWTADVLGGGLLSGTGGIGVVLQEMGRVLEVPEWSRLGAMAVASTELAAVRLLRRDAGEALDLGLRWGWGGFAVAMAYQAKRAGWSTLIPTLQTLVDHMATRIDAEERAGVDHGLAGALLGFEAAHEVLPGGCAEVMERTRRRIASLPTPGIATPSHPTHDGLVGGRAAHGDRAEVLAGAVLEGTLRCANPTGTPTPELEAGWSGVALTLLRHLDPSVPEVHLGRFG